MGQLPSLLNSLPEDIIDKPLKIDMEVIEIDMDEQVDENIPVFDLTNT